MHRLFFALSTFLFSASGIADSVRCKDSENCPAGVAYLVSNKKACTGFLISDSIIATNRHCLQQSKKWTVGADCKEIEIYFPKTKQNDPLKVSCKSLKDIGPDLNYEITPDWALLEIEKTEGIPPLTLSSTGPKHQESVKIFKMNPLSPSKIEAELEVIECKNVLNSHINPLAQTSESITLGFLPCQVMPGNSGSPIVNQQNQVVAILNARTDLDLKAKIPYLPSVPNEAAYGTHVSCLSTQPSPDCRKPVSEKEFNEKLNASVDQTIKILQQQAERTFKETLEDLYLKSGRVYRWTLERVQLSASDQQRQTSQGILGILRFRPLCININRDSIKKSEAKLRKTSLSISYPIYRIEFAAKYNEELQMTPQTSKIPEEVTVSLIPADLLKNQLAVSWVRKSNNKQESEIRELLEHCP